MRKAPDSRAEEVSQAQWSVDFQAVGLMPRQTRHHCRQPEHVIACAREETAHGKQNAREIEKCANSAPPRHRTVQVRDEDSARGAGVEVARLLQPELRAVAAVEQQQLARRAAVQHQSARVARRRR